MSKSDWVVRVGILGGPAPCIDRAGVGHRVEVRNIEKARWLHMILDLHTSCKGTGGKADCWRITNINDMTDSILSALLASQHYPSYPDSHSTPSKWYSGWHTRRLFKELPESPVTSLFSNNQGPASPMLANKPRRPHRRCRYDSGCP